jgi:uncharacterized protein YjdB
MHSGQTAGTEGLYKRMEAIRIQLNNAPAGMRIKYQAHVQSIGWQNWIYDDQVAGTEGKYLRMEAIRIQLEGAPEGYHVEYQAHVQSIGWQNWVRDGQLAGTTGKAKRMEALRIRIVKDDPPVQNPNGTGNLPGNIHIGGLASYQDGVAYYAYNAYTASAGTDWSSAETALAKNHSGQNIVIRDHVDPAFINVVGNWIYYVDGSNDSRIYKTSLDGKNTSKLNNDESLYVQVIGDWVYYVNQSDANRLYRMKTDGSQRKMVADGFVSHYTVDGDWVCYINSDEGDSIYKVKTDGTDPSVLSEEGAMYIQAADGWIYYTSLSDGGSLYRIRTNGTEKTKVYEDVFINLVVAGDWIYYQDADMNLYRMKKDGSGHQKLEFELDSDSPSIILVYNVAGNKIFYLYGDRNGKSLYTGMMNLDGSNSAKITL